MPKWIKYPLVGLLLLVLLAACALLWFTKIGGGDEPPAPDADLPAPLSRRPYAAEGYQGSTRVPRSPCLPSTTRETGSRLHPIAQRATWALGRNAHHALLAAASR